MIKLYAFFPSFILVFSSGCLTCFATNGRIDGSETFAVQSAAVTFDADCVEIGKTITASVDYDGEIIYEWYVDGIKIAEEGNTFTPTEFDKEKMILNIGYSKSSGTHFAVREVTKLIDLRRED